MSDQPQNPKPPRKSKMEIAAEVLAGRQLFQLDTLRLDRLAMVMHYSSMLSDTDALRALKGLADVTTVRTGIYADELSKQLVPDETPPARKRGQNGKFTKQEVIVIPPSTPEDEMRKMLTVQEMETVSLVLKRLNEFREKVSSEYRELVPQEKKDTFYTPKEKSYSDWKAEYDQTIGSAARPADAPSSTHAPKTAEPQKTQSKTPAKRTSGRGSRPI